MQTSVRLNSNYAEVDWRCALFLCALCFALVFSASSATLAAEKVIWQLGKTDQSSHEFASVPGGNLLSQ